MKSKRILVILILAALISISFAGSIHDMPTVSIIQVARAETSVEQDSQPTNTKNAFFTGIDWSSKELNDVERYTDMANALDAEWIKTYDGTNWFTGSWHVFLAKIGWKTSKNGLGTTGNYDIVTGFSGGTRTAVTLLKQGKITANTLCLISPQVISAKELKFLIEKGRVKKIVVYQSNSDIFTSSHFKSREGIEVRDFSGVKHGDWIDSVTDQIEDENISPELEIINPPESLVTPEVGQEVVGSDELIKTDYYDDDGNLISGEMPEPEEVSPKGVGGKSAYQLEVERTWGEIWEVWGKCEDIWPTSMGYEDAINCYEESIELFKKARNDGQKATPPKGTKYLHNCCINHYNCVIDFNEYGIKYYQHIHMADQYYDIAYQLDEDDPQRDYYLQLADEQDEIARKWQDKMDKAVKQGEGYYDEIYGEYEKYHPANSTESTKPWAWMAQPSINL